MTIHLGRRAFAAVVMLVALGVGGIALAAAQTSTNTIHACYDRHGDLRVVNADHGATCRHYETALDWNQQGPQGLQGPKGDKGDKGDRGASGTGGLSNGFSLGLFSMGLPDDSTLHEVGSFDLPAGSYFLLAQGEVTLIVGRTDTGGSVAAQGQCQITRDSFFLDTKGFAAGAASEPIALVEPLSMGAMVTLADPATLTLSCVSLAPAIPVATHPEVDVNVKVVAVQLGGITVAD